MLFTMGLLAVFLAGYLLNVFYITVLYHRGLTHRAVTLSPRAMLLLSKTGIWLTGIDPKAWACMHRLHHLHSDTPDDPHSPAHLGVFGVAMGQLRSYESVLRRLIKKDPVATALVADIPFDVSYLNRKKLWLLPYLLQLTLSIALAVATGSWLVGMAYYLGIMSHPIQGWMVNALAHSYGYRNYEIEDQSRNNALVSYLVFGEGLQNNHHRFPNRACFAIKPNELDLGYGLCKLAAMAGLLSMHKKSNYQARLKLKQKSLSDYTESLAPLGF